MAVLDAAGVRPRAPPARLAASLRLVLEGALVVVLAVVVMGTQLSPGLHAGRLAPASAAIAVLWLVGLVLLNRAGHGLSWREGGDAPDSRPEPRGHSRGKKEKAATDQGVGSGRAGLVFAAAALATLVAGVAVERTGEEFFARQGLSGVLFGTTVPATATFLPEISTGLTSTRLGDYQPAVSDIFGGNAFLPVLFLPAALISGKPVHPPGGARHRHLPHRARRHPHRRLHGRARPPSPAPVRAHGRRRRRRGGHLPGRCRGARLHRPLSGRHVCG
ncbi:hypothetical protein [Streptomyces gilvus]|uniref:hypothetical protein n=1 Tax=Streptomyces gilvus TaxID=2920937 RepID=UPI001F0DA08D|nr:hypothetical protein [Streptomyces sp. CME 23]MCH5677222.1 hypothetical protein [Streptomyces sp. CME 23]